MHGSQCQYLLKKARATLGNAASKSNKFDFNFLPGLLVNPLLLFVITLLNESVASMAGARLTDDVMKIRGVWGPLSSAFLEPLKVILN